MWFCITTLKRLPKLYKSCNSFNISMGEGYGREYFHFTTGETSVGGGELLTWPKIPHSSQSRRTTWASGECFVYYFESIFFKKTTFDVEYLASLSPVTFRSPHPSTLWLFFLAEFRVSCFPWNLPGLRQALAIPPSFLYTRACRRRTIRMLMSHALSPRDLIALCLYLAFEMVLKSWLLLQVLGRAGLRTAFFYLFFIDFQFSKTGAKGTKMGRNLSSAPSQLRSLQLLWASVSSAVSWGK